MAPRDFPAPWDLAYATLAAVTKAAVAVQPPRSPPRSPVHYTARLPLEEGSYQCVPLATAGVATAASGGGGVAKPPPPEAAAAVPTGGSPPRVAAAAAPPTTRLVPPSPAAASLQRSLAGDDALKTSMNRIRELMGEAKIELPNDLFQEVIAWSAEAGKGNVKE